MDISLFLTLCIALQILYGWVGRKAALGVATTAAYSVADRKTSVFPLMMTFIGALVGGGLVLGSADEAYQYGWSVAVYPAAEAGSLILIGLGLGKKMNQFQVSTVAEIFEVAYGSPFLKRVVSVLSLITLFIVLVAQMVACQKFLGTFGLNQTLVVLALWIVVVGYTVKGGLKAVISTDIVQAILFSSIFCLCLAFTITQDLAEPIDLPFQTLDSRIYSWLFIPFLYNMIGQDVAQKCFAANVPKTVQKGAFLAAGAIFFISLIPIYFGVLAKEQGLILPEGASVLMHAISHFTNPQIAALAGCAVIAVIISTASSLMTAMSSHLSNDFNLQGLPLIRTISTSLFALALYCANYFDNIVHLLIQSYAFYVCSLFVPTLATFLKVKKNPLSIYLSIGCGSVGFLLFSNEWIALLLSLTAFFLGEQVVKYVYSKSA